MKRGTDHECRVVKYQGDGAVYARCKCGFEYNCGKSRCRKDGTWSMICGKEMEDEDLEYIRPEEGRRFIFTEDA